MNPYDKRAPDSQYQRLLKDVLEKGVRTNTQQEVDAITLIGPAPLHFKFANGFPIINERNMAPKESERLPVTIWRQAIAEIIAFLNGARTQKALQEFGCHWWEPWVTEAKCKKRGLETGDLGPGSYGAAFHNFPTTDGKPYNQFKNIIEQIIEFPHLRTHFISPWIPQYTIRGAGKQQKVVVAPCHGWIHLRVLDGKLTLHMFQRSADVPVGVPANMVQYMALLMMIAQATGLEPYEYVHSFSDAHIYVDQVPAVETMLARQPLPLATMSLDKTVQNIFDFRKEHFSLNDYNPHPGIKGIPVAI
ncbi:MAG: thymidylate synthase [Candidatus Taylorbacteria bacterium RIFCSPLOWO2_12_FULL_47_20]|uniref:Thymidylate synthase n=2 Tax=Candidatus Tayloriibacteriota TaxID=1817919 RepID=A0A1G2PB66_9BACT|nr:MAG: thymidylate synthase [Candidatus Taylorbacteria bacterium RIFCSPLOWO2_02_FULL_46_40]OHA45587.1 MAG: thymidylate synthase [Candidatus Taylorbacteria bacterium RIFCSPLOWO2_12_FULL_47_20]